MSLPLVDTRIKVTPVTDSVLETIHRTTGRDKSEIAREVLHKWAVKEAHAAMFLHAELDRNGLLRDYEGVTGQ